MSDLNGGAAIVGYTACMQGVLIFFLSILAAVVYGIVHDQITAHVCVEYFLPPAHPAIFGDTQSPTLLAFGWGVVATWWVGAILGVPLALAARVGTLPKRSAASMIPPMGVLLLVMAFCAAAAGIGGYAFAVTHPPFHPFNGIPQDKQCAFFADALAHLASYGSGFFGGIGLIGWIFYTRWRMEVARQQTQLSARRAQADSATS